MAGPLVRAGVAGDLRVEDEEAVPAIGDPPPHLLAMLFEQPPTFRAGHGPSRPQVRVAEHLPDRHPGGLESTEETDPSEDRCVVVPPTGAVPIGVGKQPDPLVITERVSRHSGPLREIADLHGRLFSSRRGHSYRFERAPSQAIDSLVSPPPERMGFAYAASIISRVASVGR
jgi:hypothetical protein